MQAAFRRFMPKMPSLLSRRAAVKIQCIGLLLGTVPCRRSPPMVMGRLGRDSLDLPATLTSHGQYGRLRPFLLEEIPEAEKLRKPIARVTPDQQLHCHHQSE